MCPLQKGMNRIADKAFFTVNFLVDNLFFRYAFVFLFQLELITDWLRSMTLEYVPFFVIFSNKKGNLNMPSACMNSDHFLLLSVLFYY